MGFLRETHEKALKEGIDEQTKLHRTGLDKYLAVIFPDVHDWVHDKSIGIINDKKYSYRPDYRSEKLKLIIEFDGTLHYRNPKNILTDAERTKLYHSAGYKVVRIPYFIQLTNEVVRIMFGIDIEEPLFDSTIPSMSIFWENTPAFMCSLGISRMAKELIRYPEQMMVNMNALKNDSLQENGIYLSGYNLLLDAMKRLPNNPVN